VTVRTGTILPKPKRTPKLGTVEPMQPAGFRYIAHSVGRDRFQVAYTGRTSLGYAYSIRYNVDVRVTP
jgi:hypothetical protein